MLSLLLYLLIASQISMGQPSSPCTGIITTTLGTSGGTLGTPNEFIVDFELPVVSANDGYSGACIQYKDASVSANLYTLQILARVQSNYLFSYTDTIHDPYDYMTDDNQDTYFAFNKKLYPKQESFSCHCPGGLGSWQRSCSKYNIPEGFSCKSDGLSYDVSGIQSYNCTSCFVNQVEHTAIGCTVGGETRCHKMDFVNTTSYMLYKFDGNPSDKIELSVQFYTGSTLTSSTPFQSFGTLSNFMVGLNPAAAYSATGTFVESTLESTIPDTESIHAVFANNLCQTQTLRQNLNNLFYIPDDYIGLYDFDFNKIGAIRGKSPSTLEYSAGYLSEKFKNEYRFIKAKGSKSAEINRGLYLSSVSEFLTPMFQMRNLLGEGIISSDPTTMDFNFAGTTTGVLKGRITFPYTATLFVQSVTAPPITSVTVTGITCSGRDQLVTSSECNVTYTTNASGFLTVLANGNEVRDTFTGTTGGTISLILPSSVFIDSKVTICIQTLGSLGSCSVGSSSFITNDEPNPAEATDGPIIGDENDGDEDGPQTGINKTNFPIAWIILIIIIGISIIVFLIYVTYKLSFKDCRKKITKWKKLRELKQQKEDEEFNNLMEEEETDEKKTSMVNPKSKSFL